MKSNLRQIRKLSQAAGIVPQQSVPVDRKLTEMTKAILESPNRDCILAWLSKQ